MKKYLTPCIVLVVFLSACTSHVKRVAVYANNDAVIDKDGKMITQKDSTGHVEQELELKQGDAVTCTIKEFPSGEATVTLPDDGYYIINAKAKDTIIGGYQNYTTPDKANHVMTQDELKHNIDSLKQMVAGTNISAASRTFFILPNTSAKITANTDATIIGPYHNTRSVEQVGDKAPEVYRFYSIKEVRETIEKLEKLTQPVPAK